MKLKKTVDYMDYLTAMSQAQMYLDIRIYLINLNENDDNKPVKMGINCAQTTKLSTEEAVAFADHIIEASQVAQDFPYNGYYILHQPSPVEEQAPTDPKPAKNEPIEMHETFWDYDEALEFQSKHPGSEITRKQGSPILLNGELTYAIPEDRPSWTVWWEA